MEPRFIVIEIQTNTDGSIGSVTSQSFATRNEADKRYYTVLAAATTSTKPIHTAMLVTADGATLAARCYRHEIEPEPETPEDA